MKSLIQAVQAELAPVFVGQQEVVSQLLITVLCRAHSQIEGVPGVGKWLSVNLLAKCLGLSAGKLRCSTDLSPEDIVGCATGIDRPDNSGGAKECGQGPIFSNLVVAENAARLSPRVYSLIQQAVQEQEVVIGGKRWELAQPFSLFTTRSSTDDCEAPAAELFDDRFLFRITVSSPTYHEEFGMATAVTGTASGALRPVLSREELQALQRQVREVPAPPSAVHYAVRLVRATRVHEGENPDFVYEWVERGAGPRGVSALVLAAKAQA